MTHKLENNNTKVFQWLWRLWASCQASQPWGSRKGIGNPQGTWLWSPSGSNYRSSTALGETETPLLKGINKILYAPRHRGKEQWLHRKLNQTYLLRVGESPVEVWVGSAAGMGALAAAVLEGALWHKPSWRSPLTLPYSPYSSELGRLRPNN